MNIGRPASRHVNLFASLVSKPNVHSQPYRCKSTPRNREWDVAHNDIRDVAVLGGGITGLSTAYYLSRFLPRSTRIELFEASPRLGGWLDSTSVDIGNGSARVVLESGPRTLRPNPPNGLVTLDMVCD